ncbi:SDR family oxidoreductase [Motiliproteus sediminis]|uniref:SDR family oxidoreductase n=1 Tax=Motiliproteus sediminis TaxID=1468178 RepID=UPI001AEF4DCC|nr:SDR family oxidoreductase [Motiliproteus sediminis]
MVTVPTSAPDRKTAPVALVTGAGRGIGAATAQLLAARGYRVAINYRQQRSAANQVAGAIRAAGGEAITLQADVSRESEVEALFRAVDQRWNRLDALVNNAGILRPQARVTEMDAERINAILAVNVTGTLLCCREAIKRMSTRFGGQGGAIVNLSSIAARLGAPQEYVDYAASKGAVDSLTIGLSKEVAGEGIRVNAVRPGIIDTEIHASGGEPGRVARLAPQLPMGRGGSAAEIAAAVVWLLSDQASYVTGSFIDAGGGR